MNNFPFKYFGIVLCDVSYRKSDINLWSGALLTLNFISMINFYKSGIPFKWEIRYLGTFSILYLILSVGNIELHFLSVYITYYLNVYEWILISFIM